ncbi:20S-pre-rRNA D-site endonuclease nob1 [Dimargaris verticillata]|uniref:20S-pre-rRNA D-site endonuclease nob1 n=1 Tax=Dimargaris verticillata TaxID=2761393 RepID=A0A9W8E7X6_9FUNG|nr:20S-pre-rRNA D-site endonuclease nob1 [Dimargaris verticillata]
MGTDIQVVDNHDEANGSDADDDDYGWITPANVEHVNARLGNGMVALNKKKQQIKVACTTFDFAMQNVILQSGMNLAAADGRQITSVKTWVQRCHACYAIIKRQNKRFCPECGNSTLTRVAASIDEQGNTRVHLKSGFQFNTRGTIFPIPRPKGGKKHTEMVFRQDQKEYMRAMHIKEKGAVKVTNVFDPDYIPKILLGHSGRGRQHNMSDVVAIRQKGRRATGNRKKRS